MEIINEQINPEKEWLKDHKILPRISFEPNQPRILKIVQRKREKFINSKDELVDGIKYKVIENGEVKTFFTASQGLISKLAEIPDDTIVKITQKKAHEKGRIKTIYEVAIGERVIKNKEITEEEVPVVEDEGTEGDEPPEELFN